MNWIKGTVMASIAMLVTFSANSGRAQGPYPPTSPYSRPPVMGGYGPYGPYSPGLNPYLNLIRPGSPAINYFGGVLPERERRLFQQEFGQTLLDVEQRGAAAPEAEDLLLTLQSTGHPTQFGYYGSYFPTMAYGARPAMTGQSQPQRRTR
jgi:hypothetical protein